MTTEMDNQSEVKSYKCFATNNVAPYPYQCPECERPVSQQAMICFTCQVEDFR